MLAIGDGIPYFELLGIDGATHTPDDWNTKKVLVIIFTCNHCPYAQAYEERIIALQQKWGVQGVQIVAINSNDAASYPEDSFENMKARAKAKSFIYPYLYDKTQVVARKFGAVCTPEAFVFDRRRELQYHGRIDDNWRDPAKVKEHSLADAISAVLAGQKPKHPERPALGCSIKWA